MKIAIAGGTGFIGKALLGRMLSEGHNILLLTRSDSSPVRPSSQLAIHRWDARTPESLAGCLDGTDVIINLTGESLSAKRWSNEQKARIVDSRVHSTRAIVDAITGSVRKPSVLLNASAVGYYGAVESGDVTETHRKGRGFLVAVTERWEHEARRAEESGVRVVLPRLGLVLGNSGGALAKMLLPFRLYMGGPIGTGTQWVSWVHRDDLVDSFLFAISVPGISGPVNITSPNPVTMDEFCRALAATLHRPCWFPVPPLALRTALGEMADMLLTGQRVIPEKLLNAGFSFRYPFLRDAFSHLLATPAKS